jgi:hypothetical protein
MEWVPAYFDLWIDDKADLSHATRAIFLRLCLAARRARRDGLAPFPPSAATDEAGVLAIVQGQAAETVTAIAELMAHRMISFEDTDAGRCVRILSWRNGWVLGGQPSEDAAPEEDVQRSPAAVRAARYRANRKSRDAGAVTPEGPPSHPKRDAGVTEGRDASQKPSRDGSVTMGGERGGNKIKAQKNTANDSEENARESVTASRSEVCNAVVTEGRDAGVTRATGEQLSLVPDEMKRPLVAPRKRDTRHGPPSPVTEVQTIWRAEWTAVGMPGPAPWDAAAATVAKSYLEAPGASTETARAAIVGMLRTPAGNWHRTEANGRHLNIPSALGGKHVVAFTTAGASWLEAQREADRPRRQPPPPAPIPDMDAIKLRQQERLAQIHRRTEMP